NRAALHEVEHAKARGETGAACGRQNMVWPCNIVADDLGRVAAEKQRAGVAGARRQAVGISSSDLEMLWSKSIGKRRCLVEVFDEDDGAETPPARPGHAPARQHGELRLNRGGHGSAEACVVGDEDRLRGSVVLGLSEEVGGNPRWVVVLVGNNDDLGRPGDHFDTYLAEHLW